MHIGVIGFFTGMWSEGDQKAVSFSGVASDGDLFRRGLQ